jgi:hypothetical protein
MTLNDAFLQTLASSLIEGAKQLHEDTLPIAIESLMAIFDVFGQDDIPMDDRPLLPELEQILPVVRQLVHELRGRRRELGSVYGALKDVQANLVRFIPYKREQFTTRFGSSG